MTGWRAAAYYDASYWFCMAGMTTWFSLRTQGHEHVPRDGPVLLISNHQSFLDPVVVGLAARRRLTFLARRTLFDHWFFRLIAGGLNPVPVNQEGFAREGLKTVMEQLEKGRAVGIFPEGERTADGKMQPFRPGILLLIKRIDMPIVPVGVAGTYEAWPRWRRYPVPAPLFLPARKGAIGVSIGSPINSRCFDDKPREQVLSELFDTIQEEYERAERLRRRVPSLLNAQSGGGQFRVPGEVASAPEPEEAADKNGKGNEDETYIHARESRDEADYGR
jgi:1-acyl-sn-glycerol-3-phosphate acyltransferase